MKRTLIAVAALIGLASAANAATLTVVANQASYNPGDTITLTVTGDTQAGVAILIFGRLLFDNTAPLGGPAAVDAASASQSTLLALGIAPWTTSATDCGTSSCDMMNQISAFGTTPSGSTVLLTSTVSFIAGSPGTTNATWSTAIDGFQLDFFGITNSPGVTITVVPEPTTAALLGLGLFGLAVAGRRRA